MTGRVSRMNATSGGTIHSAVRSGPAIAMFLGTISPSRMCATVTMPSATMKAIVCTTASGTPNEPVNHSS
jgi:hypothetical protein